MRVSTRIDANELPDRFREVLKIIPEDSWQHRARILADRERQNPFLEQYFDERYAIERCIVRALAHWRQWGTFPSVRHDGRYFQLYSFVHILASIYPLLSPKGQSRVRGYVNDGLQRDNGLAAFAHELAVAVHLWTEDFDVEFTDIEDRTRFDILAGRAGIELEVDCKTASGDLGRQIHRGRALELFNRICPAVDALLEKGRSRTVDIVLPGRLHGAEPYMNAVAKGVSDAILQDKSQSIAEIVDVSLGELDLRGPPTQQALENVAAHLGHPNSNAMGRGNHRQRAAAVVVVSSRKPDKVVDGIYRAMKASAEGQFSGANPALLAIRILDLTMAQLRELTSGQLGAISNRLLRGERRSHLLGVAFLSPADTLSVSSDRASFASQGMSLLFRNEQHPLSSDSRLAMFERRSPR
jgi:hypothetical protein